MPAPPRVSEILANEAARPVIIRRPLAIWRIDSFPGGNLHGIIFHELKKFANTKFGEKSWEQLLLKAGLGGSVYLASKSYPDEQVVALVGAASEKAGLPAGEILESFGEFIAPDLMSMFRSLIRPEWRTLDVLENTENTIHKVVRLNYAEATPPYLQAKRVTPTAVVITYTSPRRFCAIAKGITRGIAGHYGETIHLYEDSCMLRGGVECRIGVRLVAGA
ncbi:MAG: hypothetical protein JWO56_2193 [Acidobacteria bacterium]|nr:hypothetical protein [Acidobacteriota bacterium]